MLTKNVRRWARSGPIAKDGKRFFFSLYRLYHINCYSPSVPRTPDNSGDVECTAMTKIRRFYDVISLFPSYGFTRMAAHIRWTPYTACAQIDPSTEFGWTAAAAIRKGAWKNGRFADRPPLFGTAKQFHIWAACATLHCRGNLFTVCPVPTLARLSPRQTDDDDDNNSCRPPLCYPPRRMP